jgi:hypothetical protein
MRKQLTRLRWAVFEAGVLTILLGWTASAFVQEPDSPEALARRYAFLLDSPTAERVFRLESEDELVARLRKEQPTRAERVGFPVGTLPKQTYLGRAWPPRATMIAPNFVCYKPLYFEEKNTERYGWDAGVFQPICSASKFYGDLIILPYHLCVSPPCTCECNTGYLLPGDPLPFMVYTPCP